ncbi:MAG: ABC transporter ATP-binding protein [Nanoarchaeota archaeon]|nr:ABC transporter ATP-binding protein [Nanoarchaeota archaeon]
MSTHSKFTWITLFKTVLDFIGDKKYKYLFWGFFILVGSLNTLIVPLFVGKIIDFFTIYSPGDSLRPFYIYTMVISLSWVILTNIRLIARKNTSEIKIMTKHSIRRTGFENMLNYSLSWHSNEGSSGNKIQKIDNCANSTSDVMQVFQGHLIKFFVAIGGSIIIFISLNRPLLIFFLAYLFIFVLVERFFNKRIYKLTHISNKASEEASGIYYESTNNLLSIKSLGIKNELLSSVSEKELNSQTASVKVMKTRFTKNQSFQIVDGFGLGIFFLILGFQIANGLITVGLIATSYLYFSKIRESMWDFNDISTRLIQAKSTISRALPLFYHKEDKYFGKEKWNKKWSEIKFNNINFSYKGEAGLKNINFKIKKGEKIGIIGETGSGKSTIFKLILGLYKIRNGKILIDNQNYYNLSHDEITKNIAIVLQEVELFNKSLKENITLMNNFNKRNFENAIAIAQLKDVINKLPNGIDTIIGEKGYKLSGGERQRLGIARAIYKNSQILILDEATSSLDSKTEYKIQKGINKLKGKTMLIIAHRLSTLKGVDRIIIMHKGKIIEDGNFNDLLNDSNSKFNKLWNRQRKIK